MGSRPKATFDQKVSFFAVVSSVATLICLSMVFVGCTSPFSPFDLYFMKVDLTDFPQISSLHARGSEELTHKDHTPVSVQIEDADSSKQHEAVFLDRVFRPRWSYLDTLITDVKAELPAYYHVGLLGYCEGQNGTMSRCTNPEISFSFSLWAIFSTYAAKLAAWLGNSRRSFLSGNAHHSYAIICLYTSGFVTAFLTLTASITRVFFTKVGAFLLVLSVITTVLLAVATSWVISFYGSYTEEVNQTLGEYGARASLGTHSIASTCLAVTFSLASVCLAVLLTKI